MKITLDNQINGTYDSVVLNAIQPFRMLNQAIHGVRVIEVRDTSSPPEDWPILDLYCNCKHHDEKIYDRKNDRWICCDCNGIIL